MSGVARSSRNDTLREIRTYRQTRAKHTHTHTRGGREEDALSEKQKSNNKENEEGGEERDTIKKATSRYVRLSAG